MSQLRDISGAAYGTLQERENFAKEHGLELVSNRGEEAAYKFEKRKRIYVVHRGTQKAKDLSADLAVLTGLEKYHPRFQRAEKSQKKLEEENPGYEFVTVGHSLGGSIAQYTGKSPRVSRVVTFAKGSGLAEPFRLRASKQRDYINIYDPVSLTSQLQSGGRVHRSTEVYTHPHTLLSNLSRQAKKKVSKIKTSLQKIINKPKRLRGSKNEL